MTPLVRSAAYTACQALQNQGLIVNRSHLSEIISALLGYQTYAALAVEEDNQALDYHLDDAEILVLNQPLGWLRTEQFYAGGESMVVTSCIEAIRGHADSIAVFVGVEAFYNDYAREVLSEVMAEGVDTADSNASYPYLPEMDIECPAAENLWASLSEWSITAGGEMSGEYDPDGDRMYNGHLVIGHGTLLYMKAGRAGLVFQDTDGAGGVDDSWRDDDYTDAP